MIAKVKRLDCLRKYAKFPQIYNESDFFYPKAFYCYTFTLPRTSINVYVKKLSQQFTQLIELLKFDTLIFLDDYKMPWRGQDNEYKPAKRALQYLIEQNVGKRFNGGLEVNLGDLSEFSKHLFWLSRCNASLPTFHYMDKGENILGYLCKYGNLHVQTLNKRIDNKFQYIIGNIEFLLVNGNCRESFSKSGRIKGRRIIV